MAEDILREGGDPPHEANRFQINPHFVTVVTAAAYDRDAPELRRLVRELHPADLADLIEQLPVEARDRLMALVGPELPPAFLADLEWEDRERVLKLLPAAYVARALGELDTDDAAAVAADLDEDKLREALAGADEETRLAVEQGLAAEEETAGRLMQRELVAAPEFWTVGDAIDHMRSSDAELPDVFFEIYIVDPGFRPIGAVPISTLIRAARDTSLKSIMRPPQVLIEPEMDQEEVAFVFRKYNLASAPVVDEAGRIKGVLTVDDIVHVIQEEGEEDLLKLSGVSEASQSDTVLRTMRVRTPWLLLNLVTELTASIVIAMFAASINKMVALAVLMPIVSSLGGNAGTQSLAVAVRALAAREVSPANAVRFVFREVVAGAFSGVLVGAVMAVVAGLWYHDVRLGLTCILAVGLNLTCAGIAGSLVPLGLQRAGLDPAVASSVLVTWLTDLVGFLAFLGIASLLLF